MKQSFVWVLAVLLVCSMAAVAADSSSTGGAPKLLRISKFEVKMGKAGEFENLTRQVRQALNAGSADYHYVSTTPMVGNTGYVESFGFYDSFAQIQNAMKSFSASAGSLMKDAAFSRDSNDAINGHKAMIAKLQEEMSFRSDQLDIAHATAWEVTFVKLRPGRGKEYIDIAKEAVALHKQANIDERWAVYRVEYGGSGDTFVFLTPLKELADLDKDLSTAHKSVFTELVHQRMTQFAREAIDSTESTILTVRPELSRPPQALVAANPSFWTVKDDTPVVASRSKKSAVQPAAMKDSDQKH